MKNKLQKILIVDDDVRNIFALSLVLRSKGFECITSSNAIMGIEMLSANSDIGIVLMDMMMPGVDGYEAMVEIRNNRVFGKVPIIAVTAQAMTGDKERCLSSGANEYISKPINTDQLLKLINQYLM